VFGWNQIRWKLIGISGMLFPLAFVFFQIGHGFDLMVKFAIIVTIIHWIILVEAMDRPKEYLAKKHTIVD
jgi:hypothetical protein